MISKENLKLIKEQLPYGFGTKIHDRLLAQKIKYSVSYILRVLNPDDDADNEKILSEAILLRNESLAAKSILEEKIRNLLNPGV